MVVSATKTPIPVSQTTSAVEVFTAEDFEIRKVRTVMEVLGLSLGTIAFSNGGLGTNSSVRIRGANSDQTLVLIDEVIVNSGTTGSFNFGSLTTDNIENIEVLRGAQGMAWGSDAMGGVMNIRTKRGKGPFRAGGFFEYGSFNTLREGLTVSGQHGRIDLSMALSRWDAAGFSAINYRRGATERDSYRNWQASSCLSIALPLEGRFDVNGRWWNSDTAIDSSFGPSDVIDASNDSNGLVVTGIWEQPVTDWYAHVLTLARANRVTGGDILKKTDTKVRSSYSTGFRAPTINELFFPNFGNPNLDSEKSKSFDIAIDQFLFSKRVKLSVGYFWNKYRDLIETIRNVTVCGTGPFGTNLCPVNVSKARTRGWETSASLVVAQDLPYLKLLDIFVQYTSTSTRNLDTHRRLARVPVDQVSIRIHYRPIDPVDVVLDFRWVGSQFNRPSTAQNDSQHVPSFKVVNLAMSYDVTKQIEVYARVDNLFNEKYEEILFFGTPVRSIFGGICVQFDLPFGDMNS